MTAAARRLPSGLRAAATGRTAASSGVSGKVGRARAGARRPALAAYVSSPLVVTAGRGSGVAGVSGAAACPAFIAPEGADEPAPIGVTRRAAIIAARLRRGLAARGTPSPTREEPAPRSRRGDPP